MGICNADLEMKIAEGKSTYVDFSAESDGKKVRLVPQVQSIVASCTWCSNSSHWN